MLNTEQGDAVLDLLGQCSVLNAAYEQHKSYQTNKVGANPAWAQVAGRAYSAATEELKALYTAAADLNVDEDILMGVLRARMARELRTELGLV